MMKRIFFALAFLPLALMAAYDYSNITDLWPSLEQVPHYDSNQVGIQPNMKNNADYRPGMHGMPYLRWYSKPSGSSTSRPCIILISGGAYNSLSDFSQGFYGDWQKKLTAAGIQCVDLFYRTPRSVDPLPIYQAAWDDGQRAVRVVRSMATERGIDPNKIGVISMSAGSHLATLLATSSLTPAYSRVDAIDDISCQINVALANAIAYGMSDGLTGPNTNDGIGATLDTVFKFDDQTCPMCMTQGGNDEYSPISSSMVWRRLREKGVATELHIYPDKGHSAYGLDRHIEFLRNLGWIPSETAVAPATRWPDDSACAGVSNETYTAGALTWYHPAVHKTASVQILLAGPATASQEVSDAIVSARRYMNATGITVVTAQIRSGTEVADARAAVAAVRADAAKYGLNADYIGLMGYRADAATAVAAATTTVTDNKVRWTIAVSPTTGANDAPLASITSDTPPTLFIHEDVNTTDSPVGSVASWEKQRELNDQGAVHTLAGEDADFISAASAPGTAAYTYLDRVRDFLSDKQDLAAWVEPEPEEDPEPEDDPDPVEPDPEIEIATLPWFDVQFLNSAFVAGSDWIAQSTDPAGGVFAAATGVESELVKSTDEAHVSFVEDKEGVISYTPSASPSGAGTNLVVNGRAMVESMQTLPASDATAKAGICFIGGYPYGYANGTWTKIGTTRLTEGAWVDYEIELDFTSDAAPSVRYTIGGSVGEWLPLAFGTASIQRARFLSGSFGDFKGEYNYVVEEEPEEIPVYALTIPAKDGLTLVSVETNSVAVAPVEGVYSIVSNTAVTITFAAASGYELDGNDGVVTKTIESDYTFADADYPAVKEQQGSEPEEPDNPEEPQPGELVNGRANMKGWAMKRISTASKVSSETGFGWSAADDPSSKSYSSVTESVMTFTDAQVVNTIQLFAPRYDSNNTRAKVNQMPSAFKVYGSNDGAAWTELLSVAGESNWIGQECRYYTFQNETAYTQYKLEVVNIENGGAAKLGVFNYFQAFEPDPTTPWIFANGKLTRGDQQFTNVAKDANKVYLQYSDNCSNESLYDLDFTAGIVDGSGSPIELPFVVKGFNGNKGVTRLVAPNGGLIFAGNTYTLQDIWYLNEVDFGTALADAGKGTFKQCYSLQHLNETDWNIPILQEETFSSCYNLCGDLVFPVLTNKAAMASSLIASVSFPNLDYFGNGNSYFGCFDRCASLRKIVLGPNLKKVNGGKTFGRLKTSEGSAGCDIYWKSVPPEFTLPNGLFHEADKNVYTNYLPLTYKQEWTDFAQTNEMANCTLALPETDDGVGTWTSGTQQVVKWWDGSDEPEEPEGDPVYTLTISEKTGLTLVSVETNGVAVAAVEGVYSVYSNAQVTVTFAAAGGYELTGGATYVFTIDGNKTLADNEYPAVQEKPVPTGMIWYVSPTGAGLKDGTSPENALAWTGLATDKTPTFLAKGDTLKLLDGEYSVRTMRMTDAERDEITIEGNPEHPENVVISGAGVQYYFKCAGDFTVQGIKFTGSNAPSGILQVYDSTPCLTVRNCIFTDSASASRAVNVLKSGMSAVIEDCVVSNWSSDYGAFGCDNNCTTDADLTVRRCTFTNCTAQMSAAVRKAKVLADCVFDDCSSTANNGGALYRFLDGALITNCVFRNCRAENGKFGGVMSVADHAVTIVDSEFIGCGAAMGGAIYSDGCAVTCRNCLFASNYVASAGTMGGSALRVKADATIDNCTFVDNLGAGSGTTHAPVYNSTEPVIRNCIFWNNKDNASGTSRASNYDSSTVSCAADLTLGGTDSIVLTASPFVGRADFSLTPLVGGHVNPCINSGSTLDWIAADTLDLAGNARVFADKVDLGAYEYGDVVESVYTLTIPAKEGLTVASVTTNGEEVVGVDGVYSVYPNAEVTITFAAAGGYELTGSGTVVLTVEENTTLADGQFPAVREHVALYVSSTAVTGEGDGSYANPYTMDEAWSKVKAGETIQLLDGTYVEETVRGDNSIFTVGSKDNITFQGNIEHPENVVIDFNGATSRGFYSNGHPFAIRGITFQNKQTSGAPGVVYMTGTIDGTALVENCCFSNVTTTATSGDGRMGTILRCDATGDVVVRNCEIKDCNCYVWGVMYMTKGNLTLSGCSVTNCHTKTGNGCLVGVNGGGDVLIEDSDFKDVGCELGTGTDKDNSSGILHVNSGSSASVTVRRCRFWQDLDCGSRLGAFSAVSVATKWTFEDCEFYDFKAGGGWAGLFYLSAAADLSLSGCVISNCCSTGSGGVIGVNASSAKVVLNDCTVSDCRITNTKAEDGNSGGLLYVAGGKSGIVFAMTNCVCSCEGDNSYNGGQMFIGTSGCSVSIDRCAFTGCAARNAGGVLFSRATSGEIIIRNTLFDGCAANNAGGSCIYTTGTSDVKIENCTFVGNTSTATGAKCAPLYQASANSPHAVKNCIFWNNKDNSGAGTSRVTYDTAKTSFENCVADVSGLTGVTQISASPFVDAENGDYTLAPLVGDEANPCIDAGVTLDWMTEALDLAGATRVFGSAPDLGVYEYGAIVPNFLMLSDATVVPDEESADLSVVLSALGNDPATAEEAACADITLAWGLAQDQLCAPVAVSNHAVKGDVCSKTISGLSAATTYYYEFAAVNDLGAVTNVTGSFTTLTPVYTLTIPTKEGLTLVSVETNGVAVVPAGGVYSVYSNAQVTVTFAAEDGYELTGSGAVVLTIDGNKTFGDSDYPEFQLKPVLDYWVYDSTAKTLTWGANVISNVTVSGKNLTIGNNQANPLAVDLDFSKTIDGDYQLVKISGTAFLNNSAVTRFIAPASLKTIEWNAFGPCANLATVELNEGLTALGDQAFYSCANLTTIGHLPSTLTSCGGNAFQNCSSLTGDLVWPAGLATFNIRLTNAKITSMDLSAATTLSGNGAGPFGGCSMLTNVIIGAGIDSVSAGNVLGDMGNGPTVHVWWQGVPTTIADYIFRNTTNYRIVNHLDIAQKADWEAFAANQSVYDFEFPDDLGEQGVWKRANLDVTVWNSYPQTIEWFGELSNSASVTPAVMSASVEFFVSNIGDAESADILFASAESGNELPEASVLFTGVVTGESKTSSITDLEPGTTYDYKVIYRDSSSEETLWEKTGTFTTLTPTAPAGDFAISTVTYRSIVFDATVTDFGVGSTDAVLTMEVSTTDDFATIAGSATVTVDDTGTYPLAVSGLASETLYYCRLVISNTWDLETVSPVRSQRTKVVFAEDKFAKKVDMTLAGYTGTSTITDLPVLVRLSEGTPSGFSYADCPASSIRFTDADGNMIPHEIDTWNPDGESLVWVKVPTVSGTDTAISMYYGGAGMKQDRLPESEVWSNYAAVWHLNESGDDGVTTPVVVENSSAFGSALDGEAYGGTTATNGYIGGARHIFSGTGGMGGIWAPGDLDCTRFGGRLTLSAWLIHDAGTVSWDHIFYKRATSGDNEKYGGLAIELNNGNLSADVRGGNSTSFSSGTIVSKTKWTYVSYVYDNTTCAVYSDGVLKKTGTVGAVTDNDLRWTFGNSTVGDYGKTGNSPWRGSMDEIRLSGIVQTADYAAAEYAAMTNGFLTLGAVEPTSGSAWTALVNEPGSVTLLGETAAELENGPFAFKFAYAVSGQPLGEWTTVADNLAAGAKLSQAASGFEVGVTYDYALICVDKDGTELAREEGLFMPAPAMPEFSSGTVWISGLEQAKFSSQFDVTSEKSASVIDVQVVPGTVMAEVSATETTYSENGYTNPYTGRTYFFNKQNSTFAYYGWMWLEAGDTVNFAKNFDDAGFVKIGDVEVLKNGTYNNYPVGSYTAETTGWYRVDLRVGDGSGGKGPGGGPVGKSIGLGYNINGTATQAAEGWSPIRDDGNDAMFLRTVDLSIHPMMMGVTEVVRTGDDVTLWAAFEDVPGAAELRAYCDADDRGDSPSEWQGYVKVADIAAGDTALAKYTAVGVGPNQFIRFALVVLGTETVQGRYLFSDPYEFAQDRPVFDPDSLEVSAGAIEATVDIKLQDLGIDATSAVVDFAYGTDPEALGAPELVKSDAVAGETLTVTLAELTPETTYYFCFYATNNVHPEVGTKFTGEFTTRAYEYLTLENAKAATGTTFAELRVTLAQVGENAESANIAVAWGLDQEALGEPVLVAEAATAGEIVSYEIEGLEANTQYFFEFSATNDLGAVTNVVASFKTPNPADVYAVYDYYPTNTTGSVLVPEGYVVTYSAEDVSSPYHVIPEDNCTFAYTSTVTAAGQEYWFFSEGDFEANATARIGETYYLFLSDAVDAAESGDTIELLKDNNFVAKQMKIAFPLVINGNGHTVKVKDPYVREDGVINTNCTMDVRNVFLVQSGGDVEMYDMTVMGGGREKNYNVGQLKNYTDQSSAVAVNNGGVLKMENVTLTRSNGGLVTEHGSRVLIDKCQIVRNCRFCGGGMYTRGVVVMNDSSLSENRSTGYWDLSKNQWGGGGAAENQGEMYINNCVICNNVSGECGGAINNYSDTYDIKLYMINSTVAGNFTTKGEVNAGGISLRVGYTGGKSEFCAVNNIICNNYYYNTSAKTATMSDIRVGAPKTSTDPVESFIAYNAIGDFKAGSYTNITTLSNITYVVPANEDVFLSYYSSARTYQWDETTECEISTGSLRSAPNDPNALYTPINPTGAAVVDSAGVTTYFDYSDWKSGSVKMSYAAADGELQEIGVLEMATADDLVTSFYETDIVPDTITREIGIMGADGWTTDEVNYYKLRLIEEPVNGEVANITMYGRDYPAGTEVTVLATPDFACEFVGWYEVDGDGNDVLVSPDAAYTVVMDRHVGLKAKFSEPTEPHVFVNILCEQTEGEHQHFPLTMTTNWLAKAFPAICPDGLVTAANETDLEAALNERDAENGLNHVWQNYVLGGLMPGDPNGRIWIRADQTRDEETLRFRMQELAPTKGCGFKVRYRLNKKPAGKETYSRGSYAESGSFEDKVTLSDLEHRVIDLIFIPTNSQTSAEYVTTVNTAGVLKVESSKKIEILAAPWSGFSPTNNPAVKAAEYVKASCLTTNDVLYVYDQAESNYLAWAVQADGTWRTLRTFQIENGRVVSERGADATRTNAIPRGAGAWLERKDPSKPIYLYGQVDETSVVTPIAPGWNLVGSPAIANFDVTELPAPAPERQGENGDHVIVPTDAAPINLTYKDGSWGYTTNVVREIGGKTFIQPTRVRSDIVVPVGCGFWYIGAGEGAVEW